MLKSLRPVSPLVSSYVYATNRAYTQRERPWNLAQYGTHP